jgi:biopolymer transport protein ExbD
LNLVFRRLDMIRFNCPHCSKKLKAGPEQAGTRFKCTRCGTASRVPRWTDEVSGADAQRAGRAAAAAWQATTHDEAAAPITFGKKRLRTEAEMDMTPMVDVTFQLLIFFMITASYAMQKSLEAPRPESEAPVAQQRVPQELEDDLIVVRVDQDSVVWVNDHEAPTRQELIARMRDELSSGGSAARGLLVTYHPDARHDSVVRCMDVGALLGIENITKRASTEGSE